MHLLPQSWCECFDRHLINYSTVVDRLAMSSGNDHRGINYNVAGAGIRLLNRCVNALVDILLITPRWWKGVA